MKASNKKVVDGVATEYYSDGATIGGKGEVKSGKKLDFGKRTVKAEGNR